MLNWRLTRSNGDHVHSGCGSARHRDLASRRERRHTRRTCRPRPPGAPAWTCSLARQAATAASSAIASRVERQASLPSLLADRLGFAVTDSTSGDCHFRCQVLRRPGQVAHGGNADIG